jgi:hypothetical protein
MTTGGPKAECWWRAISAAAQGRCARLFQRIRAQKCAILADSLHSMLEGNRYFLKRSSKALRASFGREGLVVTAAGKFVA